MLPKAADADATLEFEEDTLMAESGPLMLFRDCTSLSRLVASVWIVVSALT